MVRGGPLASAGVAIIAALGAALIVVTLAIGIFLALLPGDDDSGDTTASGTTCSADAGTVEDIPEEYADLVEEAAEESGFSPEIIAAQIDQESGWDPDAESHAGAQGISQLMPETADNLGVSDPFDPEEAIPAQGRYMAETREQIQDYADSEDEEVELALAAYNAGPGAVEEFNGIPPYDETRDYVDLITSAAQGNYSADCEQVGQTVGEIGDGEWVHPLPEGVKTSGFGNRPCPGGGAACPEEVNMHYGLDFSAGGGVDVVALTDLEVTATLNETGLGEHVMGRQLIDGESSDDGYVFVFGHCVEGSTVVNEGDQVAAGEALCTEGNSGQSNGDHLHLEIREPEAPDDTYTNEFSIDPEPILEEAGVL